MTELPVQCPNYTSTIRTFEADDVTGTYTFEEPSFGPSDVTDLPDVMYFRHGGAYIVNFSIAVGTDLPVESHSLVTSISDEELSLDCSSSIRVVGR